MSSHHFVKEGQEPALLILDVDSSDVVMSLLEWSPTVLVSAEVFPTVLTWGIKVDGVVSFQSDDVDNLNAIAIDQGPINVIVASSDESYLHSAITSLIRSGQRAVTIVSKTPIDYFTEVNDFLDKLDITFVNEHLKWIPVTSRFEKWYPEGTTLITQPSQTGQAVKVVNGNLKDDIITTTLGGLVSIGSNKIFWLAEPNS